MRGRAFDVLCADDAQRAAQVARGRVGGRKGERKGGREGVIRQNRWR